jgi:arsenate reductase (glutaredoxin)
MLTVYTYRNCSTCRKAVAWLRQHGVIFAEKAIRETPPGKEELRQVLAGYGGDIRRLFNTSGQEYRRLNLKDSLPGMPIEEALALLSENGNLVKRPFLITPISGRAGFQEEEWGDMKQAGWGK